MLDQIFNVLNLQPKISIQVIICLCMYCGYNTACLLSQDFFSKIIIALDVTITYVKIIGCRYVSLILLQYQPAMHMIALCHIFKCAADSSAISYVVIIRCSFVCTCVVYAKLELHGYHFVYSQLLNSYLCNVHGI